MRGLAVMVALVIGACSSGDSDDVRATKIAPAVTADAAPSLAAKSPPSVEIEIFDTSDGEQVALRKAGVVHAWRAVTVRANLLARRGQRGSVWGTLGDSIDEHRWIIDETTGAGSLAIRVLLPADTALKQGDRVVIWGAWKVDGKRRWYWEARRVARLGGKSPPDVARFSPGHAVAVLDHKPKGAVPISKLERSGDVVFEVVSRPIRVGDGWIVADRAKWPKVAILYLPGENRSYGGQDYRAPDERWKLERGARYTVRIRRYYRRSAGLQRMNAVWPPRQIRTNRKPKKK